MVGEIGLEVSDKKEIDKCKDQSKIVQLVQ